MTNPPPGSMPEPSPARLDHAAAHERLADLALEADGLDRLEASPLPDDRTLVAHLRGCRECQDEVTAARRLRASLRDALAAIPDLPNLQPIAPPAALRSAVLAAVRDDAATRRDRAAGATDAGSRPAAGGGSRADTAWWSGFHLPAWRPVQWAGAVAAVLVVAILGGVAGGELARRSAASDAESVAAVIATVDHVLASDPHWVVPLRTPTGSATGAVAWSRQDFAVLTSGLSRPAPGQVYRCWLEWSGRSAAIGVMDFTDATAYWTGSVGDWAAVSLEPGTRFVVTLEPAGAPAAGSGPSTSPVLVADLGS